MLVPQAKNNMKAWIRTRNLIFSGNFLIFETVHYPAIDRFSQSLTSLGGTLIWVRKAKRIGFGGNRQVVVYRVKASLHTPEHDFKEFWLKRGGLSTKFKDRASKT